MRPLLLDLYCGEGGASAGYDTAGFDVVGVDIKYRERYPYPQHVGDALVAVMLLLAGHRLQFGWRLRLGLSDFDAIHASPPCQFHSITRHTHSKAHPEMVVSTRALLEKAGIPWVIENVPGAPLMDPVVVCGAALNLVTPDEDGTPLVLRRHRLFEGVGLRGTGCACGDKRREGYMVAGVYGHGATDTRDRRGRGGYTPAVEARRRLIGAEWMSLRGLSEAIPPAYTAWVGRDLSRRLEPFEGSR